MGSKSASAGASSLGQARLSRIGLERIEWACAILLSATVLFLLIIRTTHAGALWRDECDSVQLAQMPRFADLLANLHYTAFPILFPITVRGYIALFGAGDFALRCFGLAVGIAFIIAAWFYSLRTSRQPPLVLLGLIGLNTNFLTAGTWVRGYGIGSVLIVITTTVAFPLLQQVTTRRLVTVLLAGLVASQFLFFDGALMPAILLPVAVILFLRGELKSGLLVICVGLVIAITYVPYILSIFFDVSRWAIILGEPVSLNWILKELDYASGTPSYFTRWAWLVVLSGAVGGAIWRLCQKKSGAERHVLLFGLLATVVSIASYGALMSVTHKQPLQRYYLVLFCFLACITDLLVATLSRFTIVRFARIALVLSLTVVQPFAEWSMIISRETNIDILAQRLEKEAGPNDVIVVNTWSRALSFSRYYHGSARWLTVPQISERRIHRYDLLQAKMTEFFPLNDLEQAMAAALKTGNRVWLVGEFRDAVSARRPLTLAPAPDPKFGWRSGVYSYAWAQQLFVFVRRHVEKMDVVVQPQPLVNPNENSALIVAEGWEY
jgi:hypothetical protein